MLAALVISLVGVDASYDPLVVDEKNTVAAPLDVSVQDDNRDREIPLRIYYPETDGPSLVIVFSHGLGGSRLGSGFLGRHWAARGYVTVHTQHAGSDEAVWKGTPLTERRAALGKAATAKNSVDRFQDIPAVLDQLSVWNDDEDHPLAGRLNLDRVGMSGHSFGAVTTQAVSGQSDPFGRQRFREERIDAAIALSPSPPRRGDPAKAFASVDIPWLLMTGTEDGSIVGLKTSVSAPADRLKVYPHIPGTAAKYELVLEGAHHHAFGDHPVRGNQAPRNPEHHRVILALSTAFWDTHLKKDEAAKAWLHGAGPHLILDIDDDWRYQIPNN